MPVAPMRACPGRCGGITAPGKKRCDACEAELQAARRTVRPVEAEASPVRRRDSPADRGYDWHWHKHFRAAFIQMLVDQGIPPICGAALPDGPQTNHSRCKAEGLVVGSTRQALHMDHEPPLRDDERDVRAAVCDPRRIQLLCDRCHALKTANEDGQTFRRVVVTGPAGAGKTTWVEQRRRPGDLVWDLDRVADVVAQLPTFPRPTAIQEVLLAMRAALLTAVRQRPDLRAFVIVAEPHQAERLAADIDARLVMLGHRGGVSTNEGNRPQTPLGAPPRSNVNQDSRTR